MKHKSAITGVFLIMFFIFGIAGVVSETGNEGKKREGVGTEGARGPTLTNPGGLPPAPETGNSSLSQLGEERMIKINDPSGQFSILFVDNWKREQDRTRGNIRSSKSKWYAEAEMIKANNRTPKNAAEARDIFLSGSTLGYKKNTIRTGNVHGLPAASIIYQYQKDRNPVTGKPLRFMASEIFIGGGMGNMLGHVTFSAPYAYYGDLSEIFDRILAGFSWK